MRLVRVIWEDASQLDDGPWVDKGTMPAAEPTIFDQVGWMLELTSRHVVLSACIGKKLIGPRDRIPIGMVKSIHEYTEEGVTEVSVPTKRKRQPKHEA